MKVALYIEEGWEQIVLTPENDTEKMVLAKLEDSNRTIEIKHGSFYECQGGWQRQGPGNISTMIVLRPRSNTIREEE